MELPAAATETTAASTVLLLALQCKIFFIILNDVTVNVNKIKLLKKRAGIELERKKYNINIYVCVYMWGKKVLFLPITSRSCSSTSYTNTFSHAPYNICFYCQKSRFVSKPWHFII